MGIIIRLLVTSLAVILAAYVIPGVTVSSFGTAVLVALVLGLLNIFVKPILLFLTLPINILTLGLFSLVINIIILYLASALVPGFEITSAVAALLFSVALSLILGAIYMFI